MMRVRFSSPAPKKKCVGDCSALREGGELVVQILVLDLWEQIEAAEKLGAEARQIWAYSSAG